MSERNEKMLSDNAAVESTLLGDAGAMRAAMRFLDTPVLFAAAVQAGWGTSDMAAIHAGNEAPKG
ncbi:MAG: hypothetical protein JO140_00455 [Candidatus Eremiobacteraeota bacterium]|nr:hypothetical protein [Candidatus Eremiobacteraeota bacterium]